MEESSEVHSEENKVSSEKNKKRTLKTPAQVLALERFYEDHKYPTEEMKSQLAEQIGLTEKQISGWFCHRRLKDKNSLKDEACANGRQDRSSGVLQDRGSGLRQDSCGSTKQGEYRLVDPREVESQRFYDQELPAVDLAYECKNNRYSGTVGGVDDTCSESSSASEDRVHSQRVGPNDLETSRFLTKNGAIIPNNAKGSNKIAYKPSGFLKVKGDIENAAITAVKRMLGRHYREDGPSLGVAFQPLPPGAFESPLGIGKPVHEPYANGDPALLYSPDVLGMQKQPSLSTSLHMEGANSGTIHVFNRHENKSHSQFKRKSPFLNNSNPFPGHNSSFDMSEDSAGKTSVYNTKKDDRMIFNRGKEGVRSDRASNQHLSMYGGRIANEQTDCWLNNYDSQKPVQRSEYLKAKPSNSIFPGSESVDPDERGPYRSMTKDQKSFGERKRSKEHQDSVRVKMHQTKDAKRAREELPPQGYVMKASFAERPSCPSQIKGSAIEMPSSFSEDETAETSSSLD